MTIERRALELYPVSIVHIGFDDSPEGDDDWYDENQKARLSFIAGYKIGWEERFLECEESRF